MAQLPRAALQACLGITAGPKGRRWLWDWGLGAVQELEPATCSLQLAAIGQLNYLLGGV